MLSLCMSYCGLTPSGGMVRNDLFDCTCSMSFLASDFIQPSFYGEAILRERGTGLLE